MRREQAQPGEVQLATRTLSRIAGYSREARAAVIRW
jgi:hypothetical protein